MHAATAPLQYQFHNLLKWWPTFRGMSNVVHGLHKLIDGSRLHNQQEELFRNF